MASRFLAQLVARIRQLRQQRGQTQEAFAEDAGISYKYYQAIEAGRKQDLRLSTLERLAKAHELEVWELLMPASSSALAAEPKQARYGKPARRAASKRR